MTWTRALPTKPGDYWIREDHWCDGAPMYVRVYKDLDDVMMCLAVGWQDPVRLNAMPWPSDWCPAKPPVYP